MTMKTCCILSMLVALLCVPSAIAQTAGTGALTGTVTDSAGAALLAATVTVTRIGTGQSHVTPTDKNGSYRFNLLPPGAYKVKFEASGMAAVEVPSVQIDVTETPVLDRSLNIATEKQTITVEANAEIIQTASSALGSVVGSATVA